MKIKEINIKNFRNYSDLFLQPNKNINVFVGKNASGKTNILEGISILISGKSFRTTRDKEILKFQEDFFEISALIEKSGLDKDYYLRYEKDKKKKYQINLSNISSLQELRMSSPLVSFVPEDLEIVKDGPALRRKFMDSAISNLDFIYRYNLKKYKNILKEKNSLLKERNKGLNTNLLFQAYNIQLASLGAYIIQARKEFLDQLNEKIKDLHLDLSAGKENLYLLYQNPLGQIANIKDLEKNLYSQMMEALERDLYVKYSTFGPHRDDFDILTNNISLKTYGSQGQKRTAVLSMKLIEIDLISQKRSLRPIVLLDDVFSELDSFRRKKLIDNLSKSQSFITMADEKYLDEFSDVSSNIYLVNDGKIKLIDGGN
ncbi:MAG: DNA replication/repair protein RecF [Bacillota bacterium]|nr:DNA replication/repair protein RecF [Bacillota bacterium]